MTSENTPRKTYKLKSGRIIFVYMMCVVGSLIAPLDSYWSDGNVESSELVIALLTFITGVVVVSFVIWQIRRTGKFLHYELKD